MTGMQPLSTLLLFIDSDSQPSTHYSTHEKELLDSIGSQRSSANVTVLLLMSSHEQAAFAEHL